MRRSGAVVLTVLLLLTGGCGDGGGAARSAHDAPAPLTVTTTSGTLHGRSVGSVHEFTGVRYALAPTGDRRWALPHPVRPATARSAPAPPGADGTEGPAPTARVPALPAPAASRPISPSGPPGSTAGPGSAAPSAPPGPRCPQAPSLPGAQPSTTEDCLFLHVTAPGSRRAGERLPVMVWWHGGGFISGSGGDYGARRLVERGRVVVITVNYRLGVLGYFGLPGLKDSGSFGFADQLASVRWAQRNAAVFGGDPDNITVFGQSAGAMSACALLTSPHARDLVDKVILMSGSCLLEWPAGAFYPDSPPQTPYVPVAEDRSQGAGAARRLGCHGPDTLACMRDKPVPELLRVDNSVADHLAQGTELVPGDPARALREGRFARIPVLAGGTRDEARTFVAGALRVSRTRVTDTGYSELLRTAFGTRAPAVAGRYPVGKYPSPALAWATVVTDSGWACPTLAAQRALAAHTTVYGYEFADTTAPDVTGVRLPGLPQGAGHASDLPYLFDLGGHDLLTTSAQRALSHRMIDYITSFARDGRPASPDGPRWPKATPTATTALRLAPGRIAPTDLSREHHCDFWSVPAAGGRGGVTAASPASRRTR
ncbi:carboxylesterase family protein [Streptomyces sp. NPDC057638]|uniref:carboxylesterase/lipase family protein n=1 Tax=Streptomyces sp. NPDC057638 TaxID=3346190 RepID=UPI003681507D